MQLAVIENGIVINTIVCESKELAEQLLGKTCVPNPESKAWIGLGWDGKNFEQPKPHHPGE